MPVPEDFNYYERVPSDDPRRCQGNTAQGQCLLVQVPGSKYCIMHGGATIRKSEAKEDRRLYRLAKWQNRVEELADHAKLKSLSEELGVLRVLLEERLSRCLDSHQLLLESAAISDLVMKINVCVQSTQKLDVALGRMIDKTQATNMAQSMLEIIVKHVTPLQGGDEVIEAIATEFEEVVRKSGTNL